MRLALVFTSAALAACATAPAGDRAARAPSLTDGPTAIAEFVALLDAARQANGCHGPLVWHEQVAAVARAHSEDMARRSYFSHVDRFGHTPMERILAAHIPVRATAENIALGHRTGRAVFDGWRDSPGHNRNMMNCAYTHHGVGLVEGYWTHVLVRLMPRRRG